MMLRTEAFSDGWEDDSFQAKDDTTVYFKKYTASVLIGQKYTDYQLEFSWFKKTMRVTIIELVDVGVDMFRPEVKSNIIGGNKIQLSDVPKDDFLKLLYWAKDYLYKYFLQLGEVEKYAFDIYR